MRFSLFYLSLMLWILGTACGDKNSLEAKTQSPSKKNATLREMVEDLSGAASKVDVPVMELTTATICEELSITGELVPEKSVMVKPLMDGRIYFLRPLKVGDFVKKGEVVAKIDDRDIEDDIRQQQRQIEISAEKMHLDEENLAQKRRTVEFDRKLQEKSYISKNELDKSEMELKQTEIGLRQSRITLEQEKNKLAKAQRQREKVPIEAPISGMVVLASHLMNENQSSNLIDDEIMSLEGTLVGPGTSLFGILSQNGFLAQCLVNGKDKARIQVEQKVKATVISHRPITVNGEVIRMSNLQDQKSHAYKIWIGLEDMDPTFTSGLFVRANVELDRRDSAIVVGRDFIKEKDNKCYIQTVVNGMVKDTWTSMGLIQGNQAELSSGVNPGDLIIASKETFAPDQMVNPIKVEPEKEN